MLVNLLKNKVEKERSGIKFQRNIPSAELPHFSNARLWQSGCFSVFDGKNIGEVEFQTKKIHELHNELYRLRIPMVIVYEGWDAAERSNIRRLTEEMDPRGYEVIPVAAPNDVEKAHVIFGVFGPSFRSWTFDNFDRSWYGRVLVERVESFCEENDWKQAFREVVKWRKIFIFGTAIVKFWVHIDKDEQLRRFKAREENPSKTRKLHEEDWRNRDKWDRYGEAVEEMFPELYSFCTLDYYGNCKRYARIRHWMLLFRQLSKKLRIRPRIQS